MGPWLNLLELAESINVHGFLHCEELQKLVELAANRDVLEIGSFRGLSAWGMGFVAQSLTCVDTFKANSAGQVQESNFTTLEDFQQSVRRYKHVTVHVMSSEDAVAVVDGDFDMVFIDAMHTYGEVAADIRRWWPRVRPGGVFVMHDYGHWDFPDVERAADEVFGLAPEGTTLVTLRWINKP